VKILQGKQQFDFMGVRRIAVGVSLTLMALSVVVLATRGLALGLDFTGGTLIEVKYPQAPPLADVRGALVQSGFDSAVVQTFGTAEDVLIRVPPLVETSSSELSSGVLEALHSTTEGEIKIMRVEFVGPKVGSELANQGGLAVLFALMGIFLYVAVRFEWKFSVGAVSALAHDVTITMGLISLLQIEFDLTVLAAILAVIGYSLNDTIVVYDRVRENFKSLRKVTAKEVMNRSVNQTLSRTIITSSTTLMVLLALFFLGGEVIHAFAFTLTAGIVVGTYSSIFVASVAALALGLSKKDLMAVQKEGARLNTGP